MQPNASPGSWPNLRHAEPWMRHPTPSPAVTLLHTCTHSVQVAHVSVNLCAPNLSWLWEHQVAGKPLLPGNGVGPVFLCAMVVPHPSPSVSLPRKNKQKH